MADKLRTLVPQVIRRMGSGQAAIYVDVDGSLLLWSDKRPGKVILKEDGTPDYDKARINGILCADIILWHHDDPANNLIYVWTAGGADHAREAAIRCGLTDFIEDCLPKPGAMIDDAFGWVDDTTIVGRTKLRSP